MSEVISLSFQESFHFRGPQHLPFSRGTGEALHGEAGRLQHPSYRSLGAIGGEDGIIAAQGAEPLKDGVAPHLRLFLGGKSIEVDQVVLSWRLKLLGMAEVGLLFQQCEGGRDG